MTSKAYVAIAAIVGLGVSGCAGGGGGFLGLGAIVGDRNLASAEPLFSQEEQDCAGSADQLVALLFGANSTEHSRRRGRRPCSLLQTNLRTLLVPGTPAPTSTPIATTYTQRQRNELIDALIATSNRKCTRYSAMLKNADGAMNAGLSVGAIVTGGLGSILPGANTAKALAGTSSILGGSRAALNDVYLSNQTIHVLTAAFEKARRTKRRDITNREACTVEEYSIMRGVEDALDYHNSCSIVAGLAETALSIERSENPGLDAMRTQLNEMTNLRRQMAELTADVPVTPIAPRPEKVSVDRLVAADTSLTKAQADLETAESNYTDATKAVEKARNDLANAGGEDAALAKQVTDAEKAAANARKTVVALAVARDRAGEARDAQVRALVRATIPSSVSVTPETRACPFS
ncbi:hypothetical protein [Sphingomonas sp. Leaf412]|uniref:hypothetical protein n=1 Tax=Sphingomonas sp. Leaf412 TaxID=1736370 RepID=UPI0012E3ED8E|nr:hypothetical protein [Sphingomonas sp. Leaf412]